MHAQIAFSAVALAATLATAAIAQGELVPLFEPEFQLAFDSHGEGHAQQPGATVPSTH